MVVPETMMQLYAKQFFVNQMPVIQYVKVELQYKVLQIKRLIKI
jgi:hypothetical protein